MHPIHYIFGGIIVVLVVLCVLVWYFARPVEFTAGGPAKRALEAHEKHRIKRFFEFRLFVRKEDYPKFHSWYAADSSNTHTQVTTKRKWPFTGHIVTLVRWRPKGE